MKCPNCGYKTKLRDILESSGSQVLCKNCDNWSHVDKWVETSDSIEPKHYTDLDISPLEYITANEGEFEWCIANVIKYVSRYKRKNGIEDLEKAAWYLNHQLEIEKEKLLMKET